MEQMNTPLDDVKLDPVEAVELMNIAGIDQGMFGDPIQGRRINDILNYFASKEDGRYMLSKLRGQTMGEDPVDHMYRFVALRKEKESLTAELQRLDKELSIYG